MPFPKGRRGPNYKPVAERFWTKVDKNGPVMRAELGPCWIWTGARHSDGHGHVGVTFAVGDSRTVGAHRVALEEALGRPLLPGMGSCHKCDNPPCVRPDHLFEGTKGDNNHDRDAKGRSKGGRLVGASNPATKLTGEQTLAIRQLLASGMSTKDVALRFGVAASTIYRVRHKTTEDGAAIAAD